MTRFRLGDVLAATGATLLRGEAETELTGISTDTRTLAPGELFVALSGPRFEGNSFAGRALEKGAGALLLRSAPQAQTAALVQGLAGAAPLAAHEDPRRAFGMLARWHRQRLSCPVIGITGSCGKTTTKNILRDLLAPEMPVVASPSSFNNDIGVPHTLFAADASTRLLAIELGTNNAGEIAALCRIAQPTAGVITNVGAAHLEGLGTLEGVAREKGDLAASIGGEGFLVLNADCRFTPLLSSLSAARVLTFGVQGGPGERADLDATDLYFHSGGTTFRLNGREVTSPLLGTHNVQNLLAALGACVGLGIPLDDVLPNVPRLRGGTQRMERLDLSGITVFDDTYNANPDALRAAVRVLLGIHGFRRRVLVFGDMLELGELSGELHHRLGFEAAQGGVDLLVAIGELSKAAAAGALEGGLAPSGVVHLPTTEEAVREVAGIVREGDVCLVKGSRAMRLELVVRRLVEAWSLGEKEGQGSPANG